MRKDTNARPKFETANFERYERHFRRSIEDPLDITKKARKRAFDALKLERETHNAENGLPLDTPLEGEAARVRGLADLYALTPELQAQSEAAKQWYKGVAIINARDIAELIGITSPRQWRYNNGIPRKLTAAQAAYILDGMPKSTAEYQDAEEQVSEHSPKAKQEDEVTAFFGRGSKSSEPSKSELDEVDHDHFRITVAKAVRNTAGLIDPKNPQKDPLSKYAMRKALTKIGRKVGRWTFLKCLSNSEATTGNAIVIYEAQCETCGGLAKVPYRSAVGKACPTCSAAERAQKRKELEKQEREQDRTKIKKPIKVWVTAAGFKFQPTCPTDAKGKIVFTNKGSTFNEQALDAEDLQQQLDALRPKQPEETGYEDTTDNPATVTILQMEAAEQAELDDEEVELKLAEAHKNLDIPDF